MSTYDAETIARGLHAIANSIEHLTKNSEASGVPLSIINRLVKNTALVEAAKRVRAENEASSAPLSIREIEQIILAGVEPEP